MTEKRDGQIKGHTCADGSTQRAYTNRDKPASPTVFTELILITGVIDVKEKHDDMMADIPNAFVQTEIGEKPTREKIFMKICGPLVDILLEIDHDLYGPYVVYDHGEKLVYVIMLKALYGMILSSMLYYQKIRKDLESIGYKMNPYEPCVANKIIKGSQHTVASFVDDLKTSHKLKEVNDEFLVWLEATNRKIADVKGIRGTRHDYRAMSLDFSESGVMKVDMVEYVTDMVKDFPDNLPKKKVMCPWTDKMFRINENSKPLDEKCKEIFHTFTIKGMFVCKHARQDIQLGICFLATQVWEPTEQDWAKLVRLMAYLHDTKSLMLCLIADEFGNVYWWVDASPAVYPDYKSHTGAVMSMGKGAVSSLSTKQKVNTCSSTEAEFVETTQHGPFVE